MSFSVFKNCKNFIKKKNKTKEINFFPPINNNYYQQNIDNLSESSFLNKMYY